MVRANAPDLVRAARDLGVDPVTRLRVRFVEAMWPEVRFIHDMDEQVVCLREMRRLAGQSIGAQIVSVGFIVGWALMGLFFVYRIEPLTRTVLPWAISYGVFFGVVPLVIATARLCVMRSRQRRVLRLVLQSRGYAICADCGYDLRGLQNDARCPECGAKREA